MSKSAIPSGRDGEAFTLTEVRGKVLESIKVYQMEGALNLDFDFDDNTTLELVLQVGFRASARLLEVKNGNTRILKSIRRTRVSKQ